MGAFRGHPLVQLVIRYSRLENPVPLAHIKHTLEVLYLTNGNIHYIPKAYFRGCRNLRRVVLSRNRLASLPDLGYISDKIYLLEAWGNNFDNMNVLYNVTFPRLHSLYLSDNHVSSFDVTSLLSMPFLGVLHLSGNNITHLQNPENFIISKRFNLELGKNPWYCGKDLSWMLQWESIEYFPPPPDVMAWAIFKNFYICDMEDVECYTPDNLQGMKLWNISKSISSLIILIKRYPVA